MLVGIDGSRALRPLRTGTEVYSRDLIAALASRDSGNKYRLYFDRKPPITLADGAAVEIRIIELRRLWTHVRLGLELVQHPPDVLFVPAHVIPLVCPVPSVVTIHDVGYLWYRSAYRPTDWILLHLGTLRNARGARRIVVDSHATAADVARYFNVSPRKIRVAYLGCPAANPPEQFSARSTLLDSPEPYFLFVGTLQPRKNLVRLLEAFAVVRKTWRRPVLLVMAGAGAMHAARLRQRSERLGIADAVRWPGYVADAERASMYAGAVAFVFPSLHEGFGLPVLEAMACGTAVIASDAASLPEVVGSAGLLVDPYNVGGLAAAMLRVLEDGVLRSSLIELGRQQVKKFTWDRCAAAVERSFAEAYAGEG
ncbi:MAG TPA: glycosyltransferase family 1 protein [Chloroflexota bacterium]|nr:glycosyltransferase family 1 protein [Chloroflexota bacterium]